MRDISVTSRWRAAGIGCALILAAAVGAAAIWGAPAGFLILMVALLAASAGANVALADRDEAARLQDFNRGEGRQDV